MINKLCDNKMSLDDELLEASSALDFEKIKGLLADDADPGHQDPATGHGPLHKVVIAAKELSKEDDAVEIVEYLLANGAVWMQGQSLSCLRLNVSFYSGSK